MKLSREKVLHLSHLILGYLDKDDGVEYFDEPGVALMLCDLPRASFTLFSGRAPLSRNDAWAALVHADPATHELPALIGELSDRLQSRYLFGGLASSRTRTPVASAIALRIAGATATVAHSATPLAPRLADGSTFSTMRVMISGVSRAVGMR